MIDRARARFAAFTALFVACAGYGSFVPLAWRPVSWSAGLTQFMGLKFTPLEHLWTGDFFTNVLVFLPIGFFAIGWAMSPNTRGPSQAVWAAVLVVLSCALFSLALELGQTYIVARTPSWSDVFGQSVGAVLGVTLWLLAGARLVTWAASALGADSRDERLQQLLALYAAGWVALASLPVLFPKIAHPALNQWRANLDLSPLTLLGPLVIACLGVMPLGAFAARMTLRNGWRSVAAAAGGVVLLLALADRVRQVQLLPTDGHLAANLVGFVIGWFVASQAVSLRRWCATRASPVAVAGLIATTAVIVLQYLAPFNFGVRPAVLEWRIRILYERAPFHRYYWTPPLIALGEAVTVMALAGLCGGLLRRVRSPGLAISTCTVLTTLLFTGIEWAQLYLPSRRADPTDVMLAAVGALTGAMVSAAIEPSPPTSRA